ncbi:MAG: TonB family protein [Bacteroidetes bacterium 38_7]|jgi:TonB family protein|nr:MAG: TonB family protein [Bacteroidetes bacterium 38_7]
MIKINIFLILLFFTIEISAQSDSGVSNSDTIFHRYENGFIINCQRANAEGYSIPRSKYNSFYYVNKIYYLQTDSLMAEYEAYDVISNGTTITIKNGKYEEWYISGEKRVSCFYSDNKLNGEFKVYYKNGNLKRSELWKNGEWQHGECFDEFGNKTQYCSYHELPEYIGGLPALYKYLSKNTVYPKDASKNRIQGRVLVVFIIETDGSITDVKIAKGVDKHLDYEAMRVVSKMPKWKPGRFEGNLVKSKITLPITFKLD